MTKRVALEYMLANITLDKDSPIYDKLVEAASICIETIEESIKKEEIKMNVALLSPSRRIRMTNGDIIRNSKDEMIADLLSHLVCHDCKSFFNCKECFPDDEGCAKQILKWLQSEKEE